jgi:ADP-ribose pyrophosphatase YjhB (NUDIX family)
VAPAGGSKADNAVVTEPLRIPCVGGIVRDDAGRLLLIRRGTEPGLGRWSVPGGRVEPGEDDRAAVRREVAEETGLEVSAHAVVGTVERPGPGGSTYTITDYACGLASDPSAARAGDDADAVAWVADADLAGYDLVDGLYDALLGWGLVTRPA